VHIDPILILVQVAPVDPEAASRAGGSPGSTDHLRKVNPSGRCWRSRSRSTTSTTTRWSPTSACRS